jgi:hypothetical protein
MADIIDPERKDGRGLPQEGNGAFLGLVILDGQVHRARAPVDRDEQIALAALAIGGLQLEQVLDVHVDGTETVIPGSPLAADRSGGRSGRPAAETFPFEDAPDSVALERLSLNDLETKMNRRVSRIYLVPRPRAQRRFWTDFKHLYHVSMTGTHGAMVRQRPFGEPVGPAASDRFWSVRLGIRWGNGSAAELVASVAVPQSDGVVERSQV